MGDSGYNWDDCMAYSAHSDVGMRRSNNQDSHREVIVPDVDTWHSRGHLFVMADGMGAHAAGELASTQAVEGIRYLYYKHTELSPPEALLKSVVDTNGEIHRRGQANVDFHNMGTTCSSMLLLPQGALLAHVGDSRVYRVRGKVIEQLTFDHSLVWEMRAAGQISDDENAAIGIPKNVITRSLGPRPSVQVDLEGPFPVEEGDVFLLCSDGLTARISDEEIGAAMTLYPPDEAVKLLVGLTNIRGGPDNTTITIVSVTGPDMVSRATKSVPLSVGEDKPGRPVHFAVWIVLGVSILAAIMMFFSGQQSLAALFSVIAVASLATGIIWMLSTGGSSKSLGGGQRLGKGPYTKHTVLSEQDFIRRVQDSIREAGQQLRRDDQVVPEQLGEFQREIDLLVEALRHHRESDSVI